MKTICICVGVTEHQDSKFETIPGAQADAGRFMSALLSWGVPNQWIHFLSNEQATKANIIKKFCDCRSSFDTDAKLIFYFAGHGIRETRPAHGFPESSLVLYDTLSENPSTTGLRLVELMQLIRSLRPAQVFLFIDACNLRLNHIDNPLNDENILSTTNSKGLFCLFSSGIHKSYECTLHQYGYFTHALLKALGELRLNKNATCHDISKKVTSYLKDKSLPVPEVYHIGSEQLWPLENNYKITQKLASDDFHNQVMRLDALGTLQDHLVAFRDPVVWIWGEGGKGKTVLVEQLKKHKACAVYTTIPRNLNGVHQIQQSLIEQVRLQKSELFFTRPPECALSQALSHLANLQPDSIFILDHLDRLSENDLEAIILEIDSTILPTILVSRYACPVKFFKNRNSKILSWEAIGFTLEEVEDLLIRGGVDPSLSLALHNASRGNAQKIQQMAAKLANPQIIGEGEMTKEFICTIVAIVACGGFLDQYLFCRTFNLKPGSLEVLLKLGLIRYTEVGCIPHDLLIDMVSENNWELDLHKASSYWDIQVQQTPYNQWACRSLVILVSQLEKCVSYKTSLTLCLETLGEKENLNYLIDLVRIFKKEGWDELILNAINSLIIFEEYHISGEMLRDLLDSEDIEIKRQAIRHEAKRFLWLAYYEECLNLNTPLMKRCRNTTINISFTNSLATAHFGLGNFDEALHYFDKVINYKGQRDEREVGIAKYYKGLILTYRGENFFKAKKMFESSLQIFESTRYYVYFMIGLNGLADIYYRAEQWHPALANLKRAEELGETLRHKSYLLFTRRNIARVYLRLYGAFSHELSLTVMSMEKLLEEISGMGDNWSIQWAQNTLATVYAHRKDILQLEKLTQNFKDNGENLKESRVYTLANWGHLASLKNNYSLANQYYTDAFTMCKNMNYNFALKELKDDLRGISGRR